MTGHGPDAETFEKASTRDISQPDRITDTMAFMFETRLSIRPTKLRARGGAAAARLLPRAGRGWRSTSTRGSHERAGPPQARIPSAKREGRPMNGPNETHDVALRSWVESANAAGTDFPIQNLPFGVFRRKGSNEAFRGGVAIGDEILDLAAAHKAGAFAGEAAGAAANCAGPALNAFMAMGPSAWSALRFALSRALREGSPLAEKLRGALVQQAHAEHVVPARIGDYTDFYASVHHATTVGKMFRPDNPLLPNYKWVPIGYHGRASSIGVSGQTFPRPLGQTMPPGAAEPAFGPSEAPRLRARGRHLRRRRQRRGRADRDRRGRVARLRAVPAQRLVGARHPGLGVPAARAVPREELRDDGLAVDRDARGARAVSRRVDAGRRRPAAAALSRFAGRARARRVRRRARGVARDGADAQPPAQRRCACRARASDTPTGRSGRWSRTTRSTAATCSRATSSAAARCRARRRRRRGRCSSCPSGGKKPVEAPQRRDARLPRGRRRGDPARGGGAPGLPRASASASVGGRCWPQRRTARLVDNLSAGCSSVRGPRASQTPDRRAVRARAPGTIRAFARAHPDEARTLKNETRDGALCRGIARPQGRHRRLRRRADAPGRARRLGLLRAAPRDPLRQANGPLGSRWFEVDSRSSRRHCRAPINGWMVPRT